MLTAWVRSVDAKPEVDLENDVMDGVLGINEHRVGWDVYSRCLLLHVKHVRVTQHGPHDLAIDAHTGLEEQEHHVLAGFGKGE